MNFFQRRRFLKRANLLDLTPIRLHEYETEENGKVTLLVKKFRNEAFGKFMLGRRSPYFRIHLDETGSALWKEIDDSANVSLIAERLRALWNDSPDKLSELEDRISKFMSKLYDNRYISFKEIERKE
jgi:hypothetical protein